MNEREVEFLVDYHRNYWDRERDRMTAYSRAYMGTMFDSSVASLFENNITVNTSDGYAYVEGFVASLFSKSPALTVGPDAKGTGNPEVVQACVNRFLYDKMIVCERGLRYSLIYPYSFFKLAIRETESLLDAVEIRTVHPWDVIVDHDAEEWHESRFVGHRYYLPYNQARKKFPGIKFDPVVKEDYLNSSVNPGYGDSSTDSQSSDASYDGSYLLSYVEIFEFYDFESDELIIYSPSAQRANKIIFKASTIPFRKADGSPISPLVPVYLSYSPDSPLRGYSSLGRVYDQLWEINSMRTVWANGIRRDARIYVTRKGAIDQEGAAILAENRDMSIVELDVPPDVDARNVLVPLAQATFSPDYQIYKAEIRSDLERGTVMAPFTRGQATGASATEIAALTQYSASEIGRMARFFHRSIEMIGEVYQSLIYHLIMTGDDEDMKEVVLIDREPVVLTREHFEGKFKFAYADQASTPIASAVKRSAVMQLLGVLPQLGVPPEALRDYIINVFDLPDEFAEEPAPPQAPEGMTSEGEAEAAEQEGLPVGGGPVAGQIRGQAQRMMAEQMIGDVT